MKYNKILLQEALPETQIDNSTVTVLRRQS